MPEAKFLDDAAYEHSSSESHWDILGHVSIIFIDTDDLAISELCWSLNLKTLTRFGLNLGDDYFALF